MTAVQDIPFTGLRGVLEFDRPLAPLTWLRAGGPADCLFQPQDENDLALFLQQLPADIPVTVTGLGSNLLIRDGGLEGAVIRLSARGFGAVAREGDDCLRAGAAVPDKVLANAALGRRAGGVRIACRVFPVPSAARCG